MTDDTQPQPVPPAAGGKCLGKKPATNDPRTLNFARFVSLDKPPAKYDPWKRKAPFPGRTYGNTQYGCCTIASQCNHMTRLERIEAKRTVNIADEEAVRVYLALTEREYGGGDVGAYEIDALNNWRRPELTFRDTAGHPLTIDLFSRVNHADLNEVRTAIAVSGKWGIKVCFALPEAFLHIDPPAAWDVPEGQALTGDWEPKYGHSMYSDSYDAAGPMLVTTWYSGTGAIARQRMTWRAFAAYADEAYFVLDSVDAWRKRTPASLAKGVDLAGIIKQVNRVSAHKVGAVGKHPYQRGA